MASLTVGTVLAIVSAATSVISLALTLSMDQPDVGGDNGSSVDRKGNDNPKIVPFGKCLVPSVKVWTNVKDSDTKWLAQAHSFGIGKIKSIEEIYIDAVPYFKGYSSHNTWYGIKHSQEFPNVSLGYRLGESTEQAYQQLIDNSDGEWSAESRGDRTATVSMLIERWINEDGDNNIRAISDRFKVEALVEGVGVVDPRYDVGLEGVNDWELRSWFNGGKASFRNPSCVILTYLTDTYFGCGVPIKNIDASSFINLANYCDIEDLSFDGYIDQNQNFGSVLKDMATSFGGVVYLEDGLIKVKADRLALPVADITEDDCVGSFKLSNASDSSYYNIVNTEFVNADTEYSKDKYVLPKVISESEVITRDGFEKTRDIKLPFTVDSGDFSTIKKITNKELKKVQFQKTIEFDLDNTKKSIHLADVFTITNEAYKLNKKQFKVSKVITTLDDKTMISKITATEYEISVYDDSAYDEGNTSQPTLPPTLQIPSPVSLSFEQTGYTTTGKGVLSWVNRYNKEHRTVVEYKLSSATYWNRIGEVKGLTYEFSNLKPDNYDFRVMTQTFMGSTSEWCVVSKVSIEGGVLLPKVTGLTTTFDSKDCLLSWDDMTAVKLVIPEGATTDGVTTVGDIFSHYEIQVYKGANDVYSETLGSSINSFTYSYDLNSKNKISRDLKFLLFVVARDGSKSLSGASVEAFNTQVAQPTGVSVSGVLTGLTAKWEHPSVLDYNATEIHISNNPTFIPSSETLAATSTTPFINISKEYKGVHYCRVGHYDLFGSDGIAYTQSIAFTMKSIDDLLETSPSFEGVIEDLVGFEGDIKQVRNSISVTDGKVNATIDKVDQVVIDTDGKISALTQIKHDVNGKVSGLIMGNDGETSTFDVIADKFRVSHGENSQTVFQVVDGKTTIKEALIGELTAGNIGANTITGNHISSSTKITAGSGNHSATLDGQDANWRIYCGHSVGASAPFRVDKTGKLFSTNADIKGHIRATTMEFVTESAIPSNIKNSNITTSSIGAETPSGAQAKANAAKAAALKDAAIDAQRKADAAKNSAISSANSSADAKANAAEVRAKAYADGEVTAAEAAAIKEADRLASAAEARAKAEAEKAKQAAATAQSSANTANSNATNGINKANAAQSSANTAQNSANAAQSSANKAQDTANTANTLSNKIDSMVYPNQNKIQISSSNYVTGESGWAIDGGGAAEFSDVTVRGRIHGSVITGSAIQASYIASGVRMLTLSWYNQERYGSMDVGHIEGSGNTPYMGYNVSVTGSATVKGNNNIAYVDIKSYDYSNTSEHIRYTRKQITPTFTGSSRIYYYSDRIYSNNIPNHNCSHTLNVKVEIFHDGSHIRTFETGGVSNGQVLNHADFTCKADITTSTRKTGSGHSNQGDWISYATTCTGSFNLTMKHHTYNGSRGRIGCRVYVYDHSSSGGGWKIANTYTISDTALNDYAPTNGGAT